MKARQPYIVTEKVNVVNARVSVCNIIENYTDNAILNNRSILTYIPGNTKEGVSVLSVQQTQDDQKCFFIETDDGRIDIYKGRHGDIQYLTVPSERSNQYFKVVTETIPVTKEEIELTYIVNNVHNQLPVLNFGFGKIASNEGSAEVGCLIPFNVRTVINSEEDAKSYVTVNLTDQELEDFETEFVNATVTIQYTTLVDADKESGFVAIVTDKHIVQNNGTVQLDYKPYVENDLIQPFLNFNRILVETDKGIAEYEVDLKLNEDNPYEVEIDTELAGLVIHIQYLTMFEVDEDMLEKGSRIQDIADQVEQIEEALEHEEG